MLKDFWSTLLKQQLVTSGDKEDFIVMFYTGEADQNVSPHKRETVGSYLASSVIPRSQGYAETPEKYPVVCYSSCGRQWIFN